MTRNYKPVTWNYKPHTPIFLVDYSIRILYLHTNLMLERLKQIAVDAGKAIMEIYESDDSNIEAKGDGSPLTRADKAAHNIIVAGLEKYFPEIPILSEEGKDVPYETRKNWNQFFLVDPLDGTKEFIKRNGEFTVNIALIENGSPIGGVVYAPVLGSYYVAEIDATGNWQLTTGTNALESDFLSSKPKVLSNTEAKENQKLETIYKIVASRSHNNELTEAFIEEKRKIHGNVELVPMGSSLKICLVAEGRAHVYPRLGPTMEWDTAAAHAIALAAGCTVLEYETNQPLMYNKENLLNPFFVVENSLNG